MIELSSLMWLTALMAAVAGYLRGWRRETPVMVAALFGAYLLIQADVLLRSIPFLTGAGRELTFIVQIGIFGLIVYLGYGFRTAAYYQRGRRVVFKLNSAASWLGLLFGGINGWLIAGTAWFLMDINEYPLSPFIVAPSATSPTALALGMNPVVLLTGGLGGGAPTFLLIAALAALVLAATSA
ncbi:MAG: hypothetical protein IT298_14000 [Chloroflexi bacterium]|nr:MAG: hypothetical protein UZ13_03519 [Chloroflexi bacterium OLB13]MBC6957405.1 hypothetical protein [Chloroflexota bacterium]MBV6437979.1 hypothetical protein [Anaerolineae bacterium]MDL1916991.1 hypothetical protein [Anaerolineae bacterium CFX4]MBW7880029.1 hypothetical protein [Anaerolineae bacterium]